MSLNPTSLIGVGRVGLRPNSDNVTNFTLFFFEGFPYLLLLLFLVYLLAGIFEQN